MTHYYNEIEPYPAQWLRNLMPHNIPPGYVDERDIRDIKPYELSPYKQCHFFAGIAGWAYALALAGFPADREVWTGSCPCQPFSQAGRQLGNSDPRHLWPAWFWLIRQRRPATIFGEQVASAIGHGWLDLVFSDLESEGYACGAAVLPACGVGAPHIRQRLWFVADRQGNGRREGSALVPGRNERIESQRSRRGSSDAGCGGVAHSSSTRLEVHCEQQARGQRASSQRSGEAGELGIADGGGWAPGSSSAAADGHGHPALAAGWDDLAVVDPASEQAGFSRRAWELRIANPWSDLEWLPCTDGKSRPIEPGVQPLAHGVQQRASKLRAIGNAIVPQVAAEFIKAFLATEHP